MKQKPKIKTYGAKKFDWKKWKLQIFLFCLLAIGGLFNLFAAESEDRYEDLKINEEQMAELESEEEQVGDVTIVANDILSLIPIMIPIIIATVILSITLRFFMGRG